MDANLSDFTITFVATYLLSSAILLAYKASIGDLQTRTRKQVFKELRSVHPISLLAAFVSLVPLALMRTDVDETSTTLSIIAAVSGYFLATLLYRRMLRLKLIDFSIDTGSNFNEEVSAAPTIAQKLWLFMVSWAGAVVLGFGLGTLLSIPVWQDDTDWLEANVQGTEARVYLIIFASLFLGSILLFMILGSRRLKRLPAIIQLRKAINRAWFVPGFFGLLIAVLQDQTRNVTLTNRYWTVLVFIWIGVVFLWQVVFVLPHLISDIRHEKLLYARQREALKKKRSQRKRKRR